MISLLESVQQQYVAKFGSFNLWYKTKPFHGKHGKRRAKKWASTSHWLAYEYFLIPVLAMLKYMNACSTCIPKIGNGHTLSTTMYEENNGH